MPPSVGEWQRGGKDEAGDISGGNMKERYEFTKEDREAVTAIKKVVRLPVDAISESTAGRLSDLRIIAPQAGHWVLTLFGHRLALRFQREGTKEATVTIGGDKVPRTKMMGRTLARKEEMKIRDFDLRHRYKHYKRGSVRPARSCPKWECEIVCVECKADKTVYTSDLFQVLRCEKCHDANRRSQYRNKRGLDKEKKG